MRGAPLEHRAAVSALLDDRSYDIEFNGHLTNHAKHAVVALAGLGVTAPRVATYYEKYTKLTSYGHPVEPARPAPFTLTEENWRDRCGRREGWGAYCDLFDHLTRRDGVNAVLQRFVPELLAGWVGALTHPVIHLGLGIEVWHRRMVVEGLAYLAFAYQGCHPERAHPSSPRAKNLSSLDSLLKLAGEWHANELPLREWVEGVVDDVSLDVSLSLHPELLRSGLQRRFVKVCAVGHPLFYELPAWVEHPPPGIWEELFYMATLLYVADPGNFVRLHYLTSLHAMRAIAASLPGRDLPWVLRCYWVGLCGMLFAQRDLPTAEHLAELNRVHGNVIDRLGEWSSGPSWPELVERALADPEEHNAKLVYVMHAEWRRTGRAVFRHAASQFTATPILPPSFAPRATE